MVADAKTLPQGQCHSRQWRKLIVLSDLHVLPTGNRIIGIDPLQRLRDAIGHINRWHSDADLVAILGDLVHDGGAGSYAALRGALSALAVPVQLILGNHDWRSLFRAEFPGVPIDENGYVQARVDIGHHTLLMLDTLNEGEECGDLCSIRLAWLDAQLQAAHTRPVLLFLHHPPMATGFPGMDAVRLARPNALLEVIRRHANVRHIFAAHIHRTISGSWCGIPFSIFKSPVHQQPMDLVARDSTLSVAEPAAYGIVLLGAEDIIVHTDDFEIAQVAAGRAIEAKEANA
jgi:3',5'-cyclic-AMP phosphodiesterase